jgi:transposase-like protein
MSRSTISTFQLFQKFPDVETARKHLEARLWPNGPTCPTCRKTENVSPRKRAGFYRCSPCELDFTVRTATIFERSHVPLHKWIYAMYLLFTSRKGISSMQLAKEIGITQKSAWFLLHRLREACGGDLTMLKGIVEVDEAYIGGLEANKHMKDRMYGDAGVPRKTAAIGLRERGGRTKAVLPQTVSAISLEKAIRDNVEAGSSIHTDEFQGYQRVGKSYLHKRVNHSKGEYSVKGVTTNGIESVFVVLKRGLHGVYHHASKKHMARYVDEFTFRLNDGNVRRHTWDRLDSFVDAVAGKRLTYQRLTTLSN